MFRLPAISTPFGLQADSKNIYILPLQPKKRFYVIFQEQRILFRGFETQLTINNVPFLTFTFFSHTADLTH